MMRKNDEEGPPDGPNDGPKNAILVMDRRMPFKNGILGSIILRQEE
jgi:hypothetical protein